MTEEERRLKKLEAENFRLREENATLRKQAKLAQQIPSQDELERMERERIQWILDEGLEARKNGRKC